MKTLRAIDLYGGIGGWALGFKIAGVDVVDSFEWWDKANTTHEMNLQSKTTLADIRKLRLDQLPENIDFVVGSPPCTQFSYANRGGSGDIKDGLQDVKKFLKIVKQLKPKYWAMENVPRVANILEHELDSGILKQFRDLVDHIIVVDMSDFGVPQRRKRMIAGRFPLDLLNSYRHKVEAPTLGEIVKALSGKEPTDLTYGYKIKMKNLVDHLKEDFLSEEERRINYESKQHHSVYNKMAFPDDLTAVCRTVTATCTRVSRESIVIEDGVEEGKYRRLTVRERGCIQGFPITYQFYGKSHSDKLKMVGNAVPPSFTYYIANAMLEKPTSEVLPLNKAGYIHPMPKTPPPVTHCDTKGKSFPATRNFRFAIPNLRFGSGVRFDLFNSHNSTTTWTIGFYYGTSKSIKTVIPGSSAREILLETITGLKKSKSLQAFWRTVDNYCRKLDGKETQAVWAQKSEKKGCHPFKVIDSLGAFASQGASIVSSEAPEVITKAVVDILTQAVNTKTATGNLNYKLYENWSILFSGLIVAAIFNEHN